MSEKGFTLVEFVITAVILGVLSLGIMFFMKPISNLWVNQAFYQGTVMESRLALRRMVREINQVKDNTSIAAFTATTFSFTDVNNATVNFTFTSPNITRNSIALLKNVSSCQFQYYDMNNATTATASSIRTVKITLTAVNGARSITLSSYAAPRNLKV